MNYEAHYNRMIERARNRMLSGYKERHHILPRCMGGSNDASNLVDLTASEHFVAHQLLVKVYPWNTKLIFALNWMAHRCNNNKVYSWIKLRMAAEASKQKGYWLGKKQTPETIAKKIASMVGKKHSEETRKKMSLSAIGNKRAKGRKYRPRTPEHCAAIAAAKLGKKVNRTPEQKAAFSEMLRRRHAARREAKLPTCERIAR